MPRPEDVQRTHHLDTLIALARDMAPVAASFYRGLRDDGLSEREAVALTGKFVRHLLGALPKP